MSDNGTQPQTRSRRPKRLPVKTSDDNVLGISWKEERELRRAIYVSLRDQHHPSPGQSWVISKLRSRRSSRTNRSDNLRPTNPPPGTYLLRGSRQRFSSAISGITDVSNNVRPNGNNLRRAKLRATARLNGITSPLSRLNSPDWSSTFSNGIPNSSPTTYTNMPVKRSDVSICSFYVSTGVHYR
ncbi:unnamed protein product [Echinostoma caproni]|uniref:DUF4797 domain-containing protein n=1 Tax=Echinostoma caproni TaxID=27848 RepID=A0A183AY20_9TREM|nr:unnamed protein product [Echinostoma caproni]